MPLQYYLSSLIGLLVIEMVANFAYYRYLNAHGKGVTSTAFLIVVAILDAGRNALSFFLLLIVALGLSVVRESLGSTMTKCQLLAVAHFIFGGRIFTFTDFSGGGDADLFHDSALFDWYS